MMMNTNSFIVVFLLFVGVVVCQQEIEQEKNCVGQTGIVAAQAQSEGGQNVQVNCEVGGKLFFSGPAGVQFCLGTMCLGATGDYVRFGENVIDASFDVTIKCPTGVACSGAVTHEVVPCECSLKNSFSRGIVLDCGEERDEPVECEVCPDGSISDGKGECKPCEAGTGANKFNTACVPCPDGTFSSGGMRCEECYFGFKPAADKKSCEVGTVLPECGPNDFGLSCEQQVLCVSAERCTPGICSGRHGNGFCDDEFIPLVDTKLSSVDYRKPENTFGGILDMVFDKSNNLYVMEVTRPVIRKFTSGGIFADQVSDMLYGDLGEVVVGGGDTCGISIQGCALNGPVLSKPYCAKCADVTFRAMTIDGNDLIYYSTTKRIFVYDPVQRVSSLLAGTLESTAKPLDASSQQFLSMVFGHIESLTTDSKNNLYVADTRFNRVYKLDMVTKLVTVYAGAGEDAIVLETTPGNQLFGGQPVYFGGRAMDTIQASDAQLVFPISITMDKDDSLYILEKGGLGLGNLQTYNQDVRIRKVDTITKQVSTVIGGGTQSGKEGSGLRSIELHASTSTIAVSDDGFIYFGENKSVRKANIKGDFIYTIAGSKTHTRVMKERDFNAGGIVSFATGPRAWISPNVITIPSAGAGKIFVGSFHRTNLQQGPIAAGLVRVVMTEPVNFTLVDDDTNECFDSASLGRMYMYAFQNIVPDNNSTEGDLSDLLECLTEYLEEGNRLSLNREYFNVELNGDLMSRIKYIVSDIITTELEQTKLARGLAARIVSIIDHQLRLLSAETNSFRGKLLPPFPVTPFTDDVDNLHLDKYLKTFSIGELEKTCKQWIVGYTTCQCGSMYNLRNKQCEKIEKEDYAFLLSAIAYCSSDPTLMGKPIQANLLTRTRECVNYEEWKQSSPKTIYDLLDFLQYVSDQSDANDVGMQGELSIFSVETSNKTNSYAFTISGMDDLKVSTYTTPKVVGFMKLKKLDEQLADEKIISDITSDIEVMSKGLYNMTLSLQQNINQNYDAINLNLGALGDLMTTVGNGLAGQINDGLTGISNQVQTGFTEIAENNKLAAENRLAESNLDLEYSRDAFQNAIIAIQGDPEQSDPNLQMGDAQRIENQVNRLEVTGKKIADVAKEYYVCRRDNNFAEAAKKRALGLFGVVKGALGLVVRGAKALAGGVLGAIIPHDAMRLLSEHHNPIQALHFLDFLKKKAKKIIHKIKDKTIDKVRKVKDKLKRLKPIEKIKKIAKFVKGKTIGKAQELLLKAIMAGKKGIDTAKGIVRWAAVTLKEIAKKGVPFVQHAISLLTGAFVYKDHSYLNHKIQAEYEADFAASRRAYDGIAAKTEEIGMFVSELMMEFGQVSIGVVPGYSVAETRSMSFWGSIKSDLEYFCKETEMYNDFKKGGGRRLLEEEQEDERILVGKRSLIQDRMGLRASAANQMSENPVANPVAFRRSLRSKRPQQQQQPKCTREKERDLANKGSQLFDKFFKDLDITVNYGREIHTRLAGMVAAARDITIKELMVENYENEASAWESMKGEMENVKPDFAKPEFQFAMIKVERTLPQLRQPMPGVMEKTMELQNFQLNQFCKASFYHSLKRLPGCDFRMNDVIETSSNGESVNVLGGVIRNIRSNFLEGGQQQETKKSDWFRIEIGDSKFIQASFSPTLTGGPLVTEDSIYSHKLYETPELFKGCGYNGEVLNQVFIWEETDGGKHLPIYEEKDVRVDVEQRGPFVKYDESGRRHGFDIEVLQSRPSYKTRIHQLPGGEDCNNPNYKYVDFVFREGRYQLCMEDIEIEPLPLYSTYDIKLGEFADYVNTGSGNETLVMYVQLELQGETDECKSNQFRFIPPKEEPVDEGVHPAIIIASSVVGLGLLVAGAVVYKKRRGSKQTNNSKIDSKNNPEQRKSSGRFAVPSTTFNKLSARFNFKSKSSSVNDSGSLSSYPGAQPMFGGSNGNGFRFGQQQQQQPPNFHMNPSSYL